MGNLIQKVFSAFSSLRTEKRIVMLGLDAAGKTTILNRLNLNEYLSTIPTIGFNVENVQYKNLNLNIWDVGGQHQIRPLWRHYFQNTDAVIYVIDSADQERMDEAAEELQRILSNPLLSNAALLVFANKIDLPYSIKPHKLVDKLQLHKLRNRKWHVQSSIATKGDGLFEGLDWMCTELNKQTH
jgi:ADP-ribosylation factor 1/2